MSEKLGHKEANNGGKEKKDYIKEALEYTGKEIDKLQRAAFVEKVSATGWRYKTEAVTSYLEMIRNDYSYLNLSRNKNTTVMATQIALYKAGIMGVGHIDAKWGPDTRFYIRKFQSQYDLPISGFLTKRTVDKLIAVVEEKQGIKKEKKPETKKQNNAPTKPTLPKKPTIDKKNQHTELLSSIDTSKIRSAVKEVGDFDAIDKQFVIKDGKEVVKGGKRYLKILGTEYEEYPSGLSSPDNTTSKNWYHNGNNYFIFGKFINNACYDGIKVSYGGDVIEKGKFDINGDLIEKETTGGKEVKTGERIFLNAQVKKDYEDPDTTPRSFTEPDKQPG